MKLQDCSVKLSPCGKQIHSNLILLEKIKKRTKERQQKISENYGNVFTHSQHEKASPTSPLKSLKDRLNVIQERVKDRKEKIDKTEIEHAKIVQVASQVLLQIKEEEKQFIEIQQEQSDLSKKMKKIQNELKESIDKTVEFKLEQSKLSQKLEIFKKLMSEGSSNLQLLTQKLEELVLELSTLKISHEEISQAIVKLFEETHLTEADQEVLKIKLDSLLIHVEEFLHDEVLESIMQSEVPENDAVDFSKELLDNPIIPHFVVRIVSAMIKQVLGQNGMENWKEVRKETADLRFHLWKKWTVLRSNTVAMIMEISLKMGKLHHSILPSLLNWTWKIVNEHIGMEAKVALGVFAGFQLKNNIRKYPHLFIASAVYLFLMVVRQSFKEKSPNVV